MTVKIKNWVITQSLDHPKRVIIISVLSMIILAFGLRWLVLEDDMMKILPQDMESVETWNSIKDEFGSTDMMFIAFGNSGESVYNAETFKTLWDISKAIEAIPEVDEVMTISTTNRMDANEGFLEISDMQPSRDLTDKELADIKLYLEDNSNIADRLVGKNGDFLNIIVKPIAGANMDDFSNNIVKIADDILTNYEKHYGGQIYLMGTMPGIIRTDINFLMRIGLIAMILILFFSLRSVPAVIMNLIVILSSLVAMLGFMGWIYKLTGSDKFLFSLLNTSMPIVLLTIANADGVHFLTKFFKKMRITKNVRESLTITMESLLLPIFLTSLTTMAAFMTMIFAPLQQMIGYGVAVSFGIAWAWLMSSLLLPALISLKKWNLNSKAIKNAGHIEKIIDKLGRNVMTYPKIVLASALVIVGLAAFGIEKLNIEVNVMTFFKEGSEIRSSMEFLDEEMIGTMDMEFRIEGDIKSPETLKEMELIQTFIQKNPDVTTSISIANIIKLMHKTVMDGDPTYDVIPDTRDKVNNLFTLYSMSGDPDDFESLVDYDYETGLITSFMRSVSTQEIAKFVNEIDKFVEKEISDDINITTTGMLVIFRDMTDMIVRSSFISIFASIILIAFIASIFFKRIRWGVIGVTPLISAVILNFGLMGWVGLDFSHVTAILSSVIIGVGVDFAIHYISQFKRISASSSDNSNITNQTIDDVGYPILLNAGSNMAFGALLFSSFIPIQQIGGLMVLAMVATSLGTLTLMASIIELTKNKLVKNN
ncbi:MAG: MMPL family transporter [Planctomycetia bacterium]|nr:MMPL family transporter [Planctomycetia bacterium]